MEEVDLGVCRAYRFAGDDDRVAVLLPGANYLPVAPLLWFTRETLQACGWTTLAVWDEWDRSVGPEEWVRARLEAALRRTGSAAQVMVVAKSITSLALPAVLEQGLGGVWLTPLMNQPAVRAAAQQATAAHLFVGGTGDPTWDRRPIHPTARVLEIDGGDHALQVRNDPRASLDALGRIVDAVESHAGEKADTT